MLALSPRKRLAATFLLACGVAASIATSQVQWWLDDYVDITRVELDASNPVVGYQIEIQFTGDVDQLEGNLFVDFTAGFTEVPDAPIPVVHLELIDARTGDVIVDRNVAIDFSEPIDLGISTEAWLSCDGPCTERYELWIDRTDLAPGQPSSGVSLSGSAHVTVGETGVDGPPEGAEVMIFVDPIEFVP